MRPVGSKASFPFRSSASEVREKRPIDALTMGHSCSTDVKVLRVRSSFGRAGKPTIALKRRGRTNRAEFKRCGPTRVRADA